MDVATFNSVDTPAFVYDERAIHRLLGYVASLRESGRCRALFAVKSFSFATALRLMAQGLDGFAVSSLYEARLAHSALGETGSVHITTPGLREGELDEIGALCDYVAFNSLSQRERLGPRLSAKGKLRASAESPAFLCRRLPL